MSNIEFSEHFDKLWEKEVWSTIRSYNDENLSKYRPGNIYQVIVKGKPLFDAILLSVRETSADELFGDYLDDLFYDVKVWGEPNWYWWDKILSMKKSLWLTFKTLEFPVKRVTL